MGNPSKTYERSKRTAPVGDVLREVIETQAQKRGVLVAQVLGLWTKICPMLAQHSVPLEVRGTTLRVAVASDAVKQEMLYLAPQIIDAVNMVLGYKGVNKLTAITQSLPARTASKTQTRPPSSAAVAKAAAQCKSVPDDALRNALQGLGAHIYQEKKQ